MGTILIFVNLALCSTVNAKDNHKWCNWAARAKSHGGDESYDFVKAWGLALVDDEKIIPAPDDGSGQQPFHQGPP